MKSPGFRAASDKGIRAAVLAVMTESGIIHESIDVVTSKRPVSEQLVDYHKNMNAHSYQQYMERVLPAIAAAAPPGRHPVLVIDNASIHTPIQKIPVSTSTKPVIAEFLESQAERFMSANGGRVVMKKYGVDEMAKEYGVIIIRLPPYHCCLNPIELVWGQMKGHLKQKRKTTDKIQVVGCNHRFSQECFRSNIAHAIDVESDLRVIMEAASRDGDSDDSDYEGYEGEEQCEREEVEGRDEIDEKYFIAPAVTFDFKRDQLPINLKQQKKHLKALAQEAKDYRRQMGAAGYAMEKIAAVVAVQYGTFNKNLLPSPLHAHLTIVRFFLSSGVCVLNSPLMVNPFLAISDRVHQNFLF
ncbi:hypothetical protein CRE_08102 [Caenorhabditis remanei]|uniref:Tc1-like transposase DDE domain-containing protein n=1 Tax=Caenorhabditis remanei TaxID=31234 RepID=E3M3E5_CAERE|nr:hypothetical protein CRE_08102 [Caenorhabditis remanei]